MSMLTFILSREWIEEKKTEFGNPIRKLERVVRAFDGARLERSDYGTLTVEVPDDKKQELVRQIEAYMSDNFKEKTPWKVLKLDGDIQGIEIPDEDTEILPNANADWDERIKASEERKREESIKAEEEARAAKAAEDAAREAAIKAREEAEAAKRQEQKAPQAPAQEQKSEKSASNEEVLTSAENAAKVAEEICANVPVKYSPEMTAYIKELNGVIPMLKSMNARECLWSQSLLVSMDKGYGFSSFLGALVKLYQAHGLVEKAEPEVAIKEIVIENKSQDNKYADWKNALSRAQEFAQFNQRRSQKIILAIDISQWQSELNSSAVVEYLRQISEASYNFTCVFRVPFMEHQVVKSIGEVLADVMSVRTLVVAPMAIEEMVDYIKVQLEKLGCKLSEDCDSVLERLIIKEKSDDSFFGYKTLDKVVKEMVYHKAFLNSAAGTVNNLIEAADLTSLVEEPDLGEDPRELLARLIGMADVKRHIEEIVIQIKTQKEMVAQGMSLERPSIHMMFTGNPGTGKTTVARILARLMKEEGVLRKGYFYEITGRHLCGRYIGETAPKTSTYCRDAYGSVLFIDEAYSLYQGDGRDYGKEAVQTLLAEMENHRDDFCVIMAGYKSEMEQLLTINPGLESRIPYVIDFPNYSREDMEEIFFAMMDGTFKYDDTLKEAVHDFFASIPDSFMEDESFSNARLVRNLFERAWGKAAYRRNLNGEAQMEIRKEDLISASEEGEFKKLMEKGKNSHKHIGFVTG